MIRINRFALSVAFTLLTFSIGIVSYSFPGASSANVKASASDAKQSYDYDTIHVLAASYFSVRDDWSATLTLNNKGPKPIEVALTLFSLSGARFEAQPVSVKGASFRVVDLREIVAQAGSLFNEGSLQITYKGKDLELGAQVKLIDENRSLIFDEQLTYPAAMLASTRLEGVWWLPSRKSELRFVVSNTTDSVLPITVRVEGVAPKQKEPASLTLGPRETRVLDILQDLVGKNGGALKELGGISIRHSGAKGALLARGLIQESTRGYSAAIQFLDPGNAKSSKLQGAGLRLSQNLRPVIVARNIGESVTTITGRAPYTSSDGAASAVEFPALRLGPGEIGIINTSAILQRGRVDSNISAGLEFEYEGSPGSILVSALTVSQDGNQVFRIPISDPDSHRSSTGGYPWFIEDDSSTVVYIKNVTDRPQRFRLDLDFAGGAYALGLKTVEAHQTMTIDVRSLRNMQIQDINKRVIPPEANRGQIRWSSYGPENLTLIGRAEQADVSKSLSSTYACENCCGDSFFSGWLTPDSVIGPVGGITQFLAIEQDVNCYNQPSEPFPAPTNIWSSSNSAVASVNSNGEATCLYPGGASISATWTSYIWETEFLDNGVRCKVEEVTGSGNSQVQVIDFQITTSNATIWPSGTGAAGATTSTTITVQTTPATPGQSVEVFFGEIQGSGGHVNHAGMRPLGTLAAANGATDANGQFETTYTSPVFGGAVGILARVGGASTTRGVTQEVSVPGLAALGASNDYHLHHNDPFHPSYHFGAASARTNLPLIASDYNSQFYPTGNVPAADRLSFNDMSLINGGKFEIDGNWNLVNARHGEHRLGLNCDLRSFNVPQSRWAALTGIFEQRGSPNFLDETASANHWHLRF